MNLLSNMVSIIKVGFTAKHLSVAVQNSKLCISVLGIMYKLGYIRGFVISNKKQIIVLLKYSNNKSVIRNINVISTPGRRVYIRYSSLNKIISKSNAGSYIISTSRGVITDQESEMFSIGGEVLVKIS